MAGGLSLGMSSCDDGGNDKRNVEQRQFVGTATMTVMGLQAVVNNDSVRISPMSSDPSMATITFGGQSGTVDAMSMTFNIGSFTIDSVLVDYTSDGYTMRRTNKFTTTATTAEVSGAFGFPSTPTPVTGSLGSAEVKGQNLTLHIDGLKLVNIQGMPDITMDYSGTQTTQQ